MIKDIINSYQQNCSRITEIADLCEKEKRERNEAEEKEYQAIIRENQLLQMKLQAQAAAHLRENPNSAKDVIKVIRENAAAGQRSEITLMRDIMMVNDANNGGVIPLNVQEILKPLQEGFILDLLGLPMPTGLAGDFIWPSYEMVEANLADEGAELTDTKIPFHKLQARPERMGIAIPVTNQALNQTDGILDMIIREVMPLAIKQLLNKIICGVKPVNNATQNIGPFANIKKNKKSEIVNLSAVPTFQELNSKLKAAVLSKGVDGENLCFVMTKSMAAILEGTPINEKGIFMPMIQDGKLCGVPVYTTNEMRDGDDEYIGIGDWRYQPLGLFGAMRFVVDPYSKARKDCVDFVLNTDFATTTIRPEAFILGKVSKTASAGVAP